MKRKLSLLLSLMMVLTLIPMSSFAATANRVDRVVSVTSDGDTGSNPPRLIIENNKGDLDGATPQTFRVELGPNSEWRGLSVGDTTSNLATTGVAIGTIRSPRMMEVQVSGMVGGEIRIPLDVDFSGAEEGAQKVKLDQWQSAITPGEYTYATIGAGRISARVDSKVKISRGSNVQNTASIILDEITNTSFRADDTFLLRLPRNFSWVNATATLGAVSVLPSGAISNGGRDLTIDLGANPDSTLQSVFINSEVRASRDASFGDITVNVVRGNISPSSFVIGEYVDFDAVVKVEEVVEVISGRNDLDDSYVATVMIEEPVAGTLLGGRFIEMSFDRSVASLQHGAELVVDNQRGTRNLFIDTNSSRALTTTGPSITRSDIDTNPSTSTANVREAHSWDLEVAGTGTGASRIAVEIPFVVSAAHEGDVVLTVKGAGITEQEVVIAKAKKPVKIEISRNAAELKTGLQSQDAPDITITETEAGALSEGVFYTLRSTGNYNIDWTAAKVEVIEGDLELDTIDTGVVRRGIDVLVEGQSTRPSTIKITGAKVTLDRSVPYGPFNLDFNFGDVYVQDRSASTSVYVHRNLSDRVERLAYFNVVTPVQDNQRLTAVFTIGDANYTVNGEAMTLDAAPFISNNRTMLPIGAIAQVVGASVNYSPVTRTAIFTKDGVVVSMTLDQPFLTANGVVIPMDSAPVVVNSRAFVPMAFVAQAFGVPVQYDAAARTVTVN